MRLAVCCCCCRCEHVGNASDAEVRILPPQPHSAIMIDQQSVIGTSKSAFPEGALVKAWHFRLLVLLVCGGAGLLSVLLGPEKDAAIEDACRWRHRCRCVNGDSGNLVG